MTIRLRIPSALKARFEVAAAYETDGALSAFLIAAALERTDRVLAQRETLILDDTARERFSTAMRAKPISSTVLRRLVKEDHGRFKLVD